MSKIREQLGPAPMCQTYVETRWKILEEILQCPEAADPEFIRVCGSQEAFAAAAFPALKIFPISRNSMYKYADIILADKFTKDNKSGRFYLDWLRKQVADLPIKTSSFRSKAQHELRRSLQSDALLEKLRSTEAALLIRGAAYLRLVQAFNLISRDPSVEELTRHRISNILAEQETLFEQTFRDEIPPFDSSNVRKLNPK
ncbi:hypothetical protein [Cellvibrio sp. UBA7671]|uniref:hypothetical protein n=1 Tax=Cellvibrio sp. UBA7671 TaxID=1946312 RepID=UPI002F350739